MSDKGLKNQSTRNSIWVFCPHCKRKIMVKPVEPEVLEDWENEFWKSQGHKL